MIALAVRIDHRLEEALKIRYPFRTNPFQNQPFSRQTPNRPNPPPRDPNAMDIDFTRPLPRLSPELREQLRKEGKCFRCRKTGHMSKECPGPQNNPHPSHITKTNFRFDPETGQPNPHFVKSPPASSSSSSVTTTNPFAILEDSPQDF